ncbi:ABC transporter substrate-binding protein [Candidatus Chloroploca sp. Khr17]|uniref:ABC transporter substrate-binding protein n=1 Tax=Candidatus Chloroploca sp. Khr17 TaxID=2496869 RepID=UPI00101D87C6|nr:ABC transporter substrate-binding protein [Candidatus Chloroploca sp. Khr17]
MAMHAHRWILIIMVILVSTACGSTTSIAPTSSPQNALVSAPEGSPAAFVIDLPLDLINNPAERAQTVIFDMLSGSVDVPEQWNPFARDARLDKGLHQAMIEPLFILNYESGVIEPWLGERMDPNPEQDVWTLTLRKGVRWSDGEPLTSKDVVFSTNLLLEHPDLELDFFAGLTDWIASVEAVDDHTVRFQLTAPNPRFQLDFFSVKVWGSFNLVPEHIWRDKDPYTFTNYDPAQGWPVFTGPYVLESFNENTFIYVRDDDWWGVEAGFKSLPAPKRLIWTIVNMEADLAQAVEHLDSLGNVTLEEYQAIAALKPKLITWLDGVPFSWIDPCSRTLSFNTLQQPWDQKDLRWAVNYALDRQEIVTDAYEGTTIAARHFFPAYPPLDRYVQLLEQAGLYEQYPLLQNNPQLARQLIESQGWSLGSDGYYEKDGSQLSLTIHVHEASTTMQRSAELIAARLKAVGINASSKALTNSEWVYHKTNGVFEAMIDWDSCGSINEPWAAMNRYHARWAQPIGTPVTNYNNQVRWSNQAYSDLVDQMGALPLGDARVEPLFVEASAIWLDELPFIPLVQYRQLISFDETYWQNWPSASNAYIHPPSWWQSMHVIIHELQPVNAETK